MTVKVQQPSGRSFDDNFVRGRKNDRQPSFSRWLLFSQPLIIFTARLLLPPPARIEFFVIGVKRHSADRLRSSVAMLLRCWICSLTGLGSLSPAGGVTRLHPAAVLCWRCLEAVCVRETQTPAAD